MIQGRAEIWPFTVFSVLLYLMDLLYSCFDLLVKIVIQFVSTTPVLPGVVAKVKAGIRFAGDPEYVISPFFGAVINIPDVNRIPLVTLEDPSYPALVFRAG